MSWPYNCTTIYNGFDGTVIVCCAYEGCIYETKKFDKYEDAKAEWTKHEKYVHLNEFSEPIVDATKEAGGWGSDPINTGHSDLNDSSEETTPVMTPSKMAKHINSQIINEKYKPSTSPDIIEYYKFKCYICKTFKPLEDLDPNIKSFKCCKDCGRVNTD